MLVVRLSVLYNCGLSGLVGLLVDRPLSIYYRVARWYWVIAHFFFLRHCRKAYGEGFSMSESWTLLKFTPHSPATISKLMDACHAEFEDSSYSEKREYFSESMPTILIRAAESNFGRKQGSTMRITKKQLKTSRAVKNNKS